MSKEQQAQLWELGLTSIKTLEVSNGILASGRDEVYGCIFGRDSLITSLELLEAFERTKNPYFLELVKKILLNLSLLQGTKVLIESGEEPGKIIHEYRPEKHEHLTKALLEPWYVYPDNIMRNYDSVDATPLFLITLHKYWQISGDTSFVEALLPSVEAALTWLIEYGDTNGDGFIDYRFHPDRTFGGLRSQSWMDSTESLFYEESHLFPLYPIAPVEVQAYAFAALKSWGVYFEDSNKELSEKLTKRAYALKALFNQKFVIPHGKRVTLAFALDGEGKRLTAARSSMGHVLFAAYKNKKGAAECILDAQYVEPLRLRLLSRDLFVPSAGIRTLSSRSLHYDPVSYHNGSIWPHDTAMLAQGLRNFGYADDAKRVETALLKAYAHFKTPIEMFGYARGFKQYAHANGGGACKVQAWSAASLLAVVAEPDLIQ